MTISRRQALQVSGTTLAGLSLGLGPESLLAQAPPAQTPPPVPDKLVDSTVRNIAPLPRHSYVTLLQCGAVNPHGIVKWTGVRFSDVANLLGVQPFAHYCRLVASDKYWIDEDIKTMMHPQVMLV